jgi:hypothetical protein
MRIIVMMMDALDGELAEPARNDLETHLRACPECQREWNALLAIEMLFRQAPVLSPVAGFCHANHRSTARSPDPGLGFGHGLCRFAHRWFDPGGGDRLLVVRYLPILQNPSLLGHVWASLINVVRVVSARSSAPC